MATIAQSTIEDLIASNNAGRIASEATKEEVSSFNFKLTQITASLAALTTKVDEHSAAIKRQDEILASIQKQMLEAKAGAADSSAGGVLGGVWDSPERNTRRHTELGFSPGSPPSSPGSTISTTASSVVQSANPNLVILVGFARQLQMLQVSEHLVPKLEKIQPPHRQA